MPKLLFNEPEQYLLTKWSDAQLLEESMKTILKKYTELFEKVIEQVQDEHDELDCQGIHMSNDEGINVGLGRSTWPSKWPKWPSGLWLGNLTLDELIMEQGESSGGGIWLSPPKDAGLDIKEAAIRFQEAAPGILTKEELERMDLEEPEKEGYMHVWFDFPQSRQELLDFLLKDEAKEFVRCMVGHFETLAKFIPVIDNIFDSSKRKHK